MNCFKMCNSAVKNVPITRCILWSIHSIKGVSHTGFIFLEYPEEHVFDAAGIINFNRLAMYSKTKADTFPEV